MLRQSRARRSCLRRLGPFIPTAIAGNEVLVFERPEPRAFCTGLLRPRVYISRGAIESLDEDELRAVLAHEAHHARQRDPLRLFVVRAIRDAYFFMPAMPRLAQRCAALTEVAADASAVAGSRSGARAVASAMLRFEPRPDSGVVGIAPQRVDHLLGRNGEWGSDVAPVGAALALVAAGGIGVLSLAAGSQTARLNMLELPAVICTVVMGIAIACACTFIGRLARRGFSRSPASGLVPDPPLGSAGDRAKRSVFRRA